MVNHSRNLIFKSQKYLTLSLLYPILVKWKMLGDLVLTFPGRESTCKFSVYKCYSFTKNETYFIISAKLCTIYATLKNDCKSFYR